jgi:phosphatidylglycerol lysyltransferase
VLRIGLLALAGWALHRELAGVRGAELFGHFAGYAWRHAALAGACTIGSFLTLGAIERLALHAAAPIARVPRRAAMLTAFVASAFSQSIGVALLTGAAVRLRGYARHRMDAAAAGRTSAFVTLTITLGLLACGAVALFASTQPLRLGDVSLSVRPLGIVLGVVVLAYVGWSAASARDHVGRGRWQLRRPTGRVAIAQVALASADWLLTATVLFAVLPAASGIGYGELLRAYLVAQTVGMASHVPGGAGVLEVVALTLLARGDTARQAAVIAALVMFRIVYYLVPLLLAMAVAAVAELHPRREPRASVPELPDEPMAMPHAG